MNEKPTELKKGFTCTCGLEHVYPMYVFTHWREVLLFACPNCEKEYEIVCGTASPKAP